MCHVFISLRFNLSHLLKRTTAESRNKYHWRSVQIIWRTAARRYHLILCWFYNEFHFFDNSDKASGSSTLLSILSNKLQYSLDPHKDAFENVMFNNSDFSGFCRCNYPAVESLLSD